jgi:hypothetical protein
MTVLLMLAGSLAGVALLAGTAWLLGLGGDLRLSGEVDVRRIAADAGFDVHAMALDRAGLAALVRDRADRVFLIRRHGAHFVAERLTPPIDGRLDHRFLTLGRTTLDLGDDAAIWAASLRRVGS